MNAYPFADLNLSRRLEKTEAQGNVAFVEARARAFPESKAEWIEIGGTYAMFDGPTSPISQTFGLGIFQPITPGELDQIELFFKDRGAEVFHEVSPLADPTTFALLIERGYRPIEFTSVMFRPISRNLALSVAPNEKVKVRLTGHNEKEIWAETAFRGWSEFSELTDFLREMGKVHACSKSPSFLAEIDGNRCRHRDAHNSGWRSIISRRKHDSRSATSRCSTCFARSAITFWRGTGLRYCDDGGTTRKRFSEKCRATWI